ncbi:MAG: nitrilase family protein, partial [Gammaproteobacteria bacterium]|nr:nitrilase family protein [Gammaproteobacteria bacterium]
MSTVMNETNALRVAALQFAPSWQDVMASLEQLDSHLDALNQQGRFDLIILPEMFATGFSLDAVAAESENGRVTRWMQQVATRFNAAVVGSIKMSSQGALFNRLRFTAP